MLSRQQPLSHDQSDPGQVTIGAHSYRLLSNVSLLSNLALLSNVAIIPHFMNRASRCSVDWSKFTTNALKTLICLVVTGGGICSLPTEADAQHQPTPEPHVPRSRKVNLTIHPMVEILAMVDIADDRMAAGVWSARKARAGWVAHSLPVA